MVGSKHTKNVKQLAAADPHGKELGSYNSIESGISTRISVKYCDFIGFHASYTDPKTKLRCFSSDEYQLGRSLPDVTKNKLLAIRKANPTLC